MSTPKDAKAVSWNSFQMSSRCKIKSILGRVFPFPPLMTMPAMQPRIDLELLANPFCFLSREREFSIWLKFRLHCQTPITVVTMGSIFDVAATFIKSRIEIIDIETGNKVHFPTQISANEDTRLGGTCCDLGTGKGKLFFLEYHLWGEVARVSIRHLQLFSTQEVYRKVSRSRLYGLVPRTTTGGTRTAIRRRNIIGAHCGKLARRQGSQLYYPSSATFEASRDVIFVNVFTNLFIVRRPEFHHLT